jgi:hypothetical protein
MMRRPSKLRKGVNFIPKELPLDEDGSIDYGRIRALDKEASQQLLADVKAAIKGRTPPGDFRAPGGKMDTLSYSLTPPGWRRFKNWNKECAVYVASVILQGNLDQFQLAESRKGLAKARGMAVEKNKKITPELVERYRQESKRTTSQKKLADRLEISQPTLRKLQDQLGVVRKK